MPKKHAKHRVIPKAITSHPLYKSAKSKSKNAHRYDMWEDSVIGGLHIFEWIVIGVAAMVIVAGVNVALHYSDAIAFGGDLT
ncbi:TPA: hypothetical protein DEP21_04260 [Patescibacteria group bacterium]|nr:hypothetical protein [Candidatus Gracilibacteria bacterium]